MKWLLISVPIFLAGCSILPQPTGSVKKYILDPVTVSTSLCQQPKEIQLLVEVPVLNTPLDNTRVAVKPTKQQLDYLADVEWADRLSSLIQDSIIYSLENTNAFKVVGRSSDNMTVDHALRVEVRKFYIDNFTDVKNGVATVEFRVDLMAMPNREVVSSHAIFRRVKCPVDSIDGLMQSLNTAHAQTTEDLVVWLLDALQKKGKKDEAPETN